MPLTRGRIGVRQRADGVRIFDVGRRRPCQISAAAIDELVGGPKRSRADREARFWWLREIIEKLASIKFEAGHTVRDSVVRILRRTSQKEHEGIISALQAGPPRRFGIASKIVLSVGRTA